MATEPNRKRPGSRTASPTASSRGTVAAEGFVRQAVVPLPPLEGALPYEDPKLKRALDRIKAMDMRLALLEKREQQIKAERQGALRPEDHQQSSLQVPADKSIDAADDTDSHIPQSTASGRCRALTAAEKQRLEALLAKITGDADEEEAETAVDNKKSPESARAERSLPGNAGSPAHDRQPSPESEEPEAHQLRSINRRLSSFSKSGTDNPARAEINLADIERRLESLRASHIEFASPASTTLSRETLDKLLRQAEEEQQGAHIAS